jgi:hypothetical protein
MRARFRRSIAAALFLAVPVASTWVALPAAAQASAAEPDIEALQVNANNGVSVGSTLQFMVRGTPQGQVRVQVQGSNVALALREGARGIYTGSYTIGRADRIDPANLIRATLVVGSQSTVANYRFPPAFMALANTPARPPPQQAQTQPQPQPQFQAQALRIDRFAVTPVARLAPGTELRFTLNGAPGANASFELPGIASGLPMREVAPGQYAGSYTLRQNDNLAPGRVTATLRSGERWVSTRLVEPLVVDNAAPVIASRPARPADPGAGTTVVFGTFDDRGGSGVDPQSVRVAIGGRDVTAEAKVTPHSFSYRGLLPPGSHTVEVSARDLAGNTSRDAWIVDVGNASMGAAPATTLPLQVVSPGNRAGANGGDVVIDGRTAPGASVRVQVDAIAPAVGNRATVAQTVAQQTIVAEPDGTFSVNLGSFRAVMGTRFEVSLVANHRGLSAEQRLVLAPRPG